MEEKINNKKDLIIFDLDGTLIDSSGDIASAVNSTLRDVGRREMGDEEIKAGIGWGVRSLLEKLMPGETGENIDRAREIFLGYYGENLMEKTSLYPGVEATLGHFYGKGKKLAIVTNKPIGLTGRIIEGFGLDRFFKAVVGGDSIVDPDNGDYLKKPHPAPLLTVMERLKSGHDSTVFVGDSAIDCETGRRAGILTVGAAYGFRGRAELLDAGCGFIIEEISELKNIIE